MHRDLLLNGAHKPHARAVQSPASQTHGLTFTAVFQACPPPLQALGAREKASGAKAPLEAWQTPHTMPRISPGWETRGILHHYNDFPMSQCRASTSKGAGAGARGTEL